MALRHLLDFLGFEGPKARLKGERKVPAREEIDALLLRQRDRDSPEHRQLVEIAAQIADWDRVRGS